MNSKKMIVDEIWLQLGSPTNTQLVQLELLEHEIIFSWKSVPIKRLTINYSNIHQVKKQKNPKIVEVDPSNRLHYPITITCRDYLRAILYLPTESVRLDIAAKLLQINQNDQIEKLYAFYYQPRFKFHSDGWQVYDAIKEFERFEVGFNTSKWRFTELNQNYELSPTYPRKLCVPKDISDAVLYHAAKFRSRGRLPALTYIHTNGSSITRSSQPLVGIQSKRSLQDEKLILAIFDSGRTVHRTNIIIDARPLGNAMANRAMGAGTESLENYKNCDRLFMGIENIHVMRESLGKISEASWEPDRGADKWLAALESTNWIKHIKNILDSTKLIVDTIEDEGHVLIHCSDGWDRTAQLSSLACICLDPYYRTIEGLQVLIEKEWCSFGHKFNDRCGHTQKASVSSNYSSISYTSLSSSKKDEKETAPVFQQFLDATQNIIKQFPTHFEYSEKLLIDLQNWAYNCQFGTFLLNNEKSRKEKKLCEKTHSVWSYVNENREDYKAASFDPNTLKKRETLNFSSAAKDVQFWKNVFCKFDDEQRFGPLYNQATLRQSGNSSPTSQPLANAYDRYSARSIEEAYMQLYRENAQLEHTIALFEHQISSVDKNISKKMKIIGNVPLETLSINDDCGTEVINDDVTNFMIYYPRQITCSLCKEIFFCSQTQWNCLWCSKIVCSSCSRFKLKISDITKLQSAGKEEKAWRSCNDCYGRVKKR